MEGSLMTALRPGEKKINVATTDLAAAVLNGKMPLIA